MQASKNLRIKYWSTALGFLFFIYSTLYIVRPICTFLKATTPFPLLVNALCITLLTFLLIAIGAKIRGAKFSSYLIFSFVLLAYIYGIVTIQYPEEKIHFIEYGILAFLLFRAIRLDIQKQPVAYVYAFLLITIFGWIDEGIQYLLPNRYYQVEDVILNSVSGGLGLLLVFICKREQKVEGCNRIS